MRNDLQKVLSLICASLRLCASQFSSAPMTLHAPPVGSLPHARMQSGFLPAVNSQLGFHVKGHVPTIKEAEESRDSLTQWGSHWRISSGTNLTPSTTPRINTGVRGLLDLCESSSMPRPPVGGVPASSLIEVVGMAQSSKGVRRLVKSVVYGLKACQVRRLCAS